MRYKSINDIRPGDILAIALYDAQNRLLLASGKSLTAHVIETVKIMGAQGIYVEDEFSEGIVVEDCMPPMFRGQVIQNLKKFDIDRSVECARQMVEMVMAKDTYYEYVNLKTFDNYTYEHSLSVSFYATLMGIALDFEKETLINLTVAGLFHDLGKQMIPESILNKPGKLTEEEYEKIKEHPYLGYKMLKQSDSISSTVRVAAYQHHENEDGTGYPCNLKGNQIYRFAKIIHIVDVYDALISKRPYKEPMPVPQALQFIQKNSGSMFNEQYVDVFLKIVPAYIKGTEVTLSNGERGIVAENYANDVLRPKVRLLSGREISLRDDEAYQMVTIV
ncbi:MAG: HD-GYP domain-containing protein [Lachnospiraceae bacterium]